MSKKKCVILFSGGLDSLTLLYYAISKGYQPSCLIFDYGQRHDKEVLNARKLARNLKCESQVVKIKLPWLGSSLIDKKISLPKRKTINPKEIPSTYVPARNIIFLSFAFSYAEVIKADAVFIGANAIDYSGYPDCRPEFFNAYQKVANLGLKTGVRGRKIKIHVPFVKKTKAQIIKIGLKLNVPYEKSWSCYAGTKSPCMKCDSCALRLKGFSEAGMVDPIL